MSFNSVYLTIFSMKTVVCFVFLLYLYVEFLVTSLVWNILAKEIVYGKLLLKNYILQFSLSKKYNLIVSKYTYFLISSSAFA